jgi:hypothetical protein
MVWGIYGDHNLSEELTDKTSDIHAMRHDAYYALHSPRTFLINGRW